MLPNITEAQKAQFDERGFTILPDVFSRAEMDRLAGQIEEFGKNHQPGWDGDERNMAFTDHIAERDDAIREFCLRPEFVAITTEFLGPDVDLYWNQTVFKDPEGTREFPWHQDDGYTAVTPSPYLTLWLALNDATPENGCISVLPGSHKRGLVPHRPSPVGLVCYDSDAPNQGVQVPVKGGSIAAFPSLLFHKSGLNRSNGTRKAYVIQYAQAGLRHVESGELIPDLIPVARNGEKV